MSVRITAVSLLMTLVAWAAPAGAQSSRNPDGRSTPVAPHPLSLSAVEDCEDFRATLVESYTELLLQQWYMPWETPWSSPNDDGGAGDFSTTNVQESGVDEPDLVKTDGSTLFAIADSDVRVVDAWPPETASLLGTIDATWPESLLLHDGRLVVFDSYTHWERPATYRHFRYVRVFDVSDPAQPVAVRTLTIEGWSPMIGARLIDGHLYAIFSSSIRMPAELWDLLWSGELDLPPAPEKPEDWDAVLDQARAILRPAVEAVVNLLGVEELLPELTDETSSGSTSAPIVACDAILRPGEVGSESLLSVLHLDLGAEDIETTPVTTQSLMASAWTVYASPASLYVARATGGWWPWLWGPIAQFPDPPSVEIHRFALDPGGETPMTYTATGTVPGHLLDQFSFGEYDGHLRVATGPGWVWNPDGTELGSTVSVLRDDGYGTLQLVGQVTDIAPGEDLYASRFLGDRGYLVTFERIDPLFTLDLSDPTDPKVMGELEMPGFSTYLHPMNDGNALLAVGREGNEDGTTFGLAVKSFDVSDLEQPSILASLSFGDENDGWSWSEALYDHHAFTYHRDTLAIPASFNGWDPETGFVGLVVIGVAPDGRSFAQLGLVDHMDLAANPENGSHDWPWIRRSVVLEDTLVAISNRGVTFSHLAAPEVRINRVSFFDEAPGAPPALR
jgi:hypothetical protein